MTENKKKRGVIYPLVIKRIIDIVLSLLVLVCFSWLYLILAVFIMLASGGLVSLLHSLLPMVPETVVKIPVDGLLFLFSFYMQREVVYK